MGVSSFICCWAGVAELADALDSKSSDGHPSWGFKSPLRHQLETLLQVVQTFKFACRDSAPLILADTVGCFE
jgi:hypothetical protein